MCLCHCYGVSFRVFTVIFHLTDNYNFILRIKLHFNLPERGFALTSRPPGISLGAVCASPHLIGQRSACQVTWHEEKLTTQYTCGWYIRARSGIPHRPRQEETLSPECVSLSLEALVRFYFGCFRSFWSHLFLTCAQSVSFGILWSGQECYPQHTVDEDSFLCFFMATRLNFVRLAWLWLLQRPPRDRYGF